MTNEECSFSAIWRPLQNLQSFPRRRESIVKMQLERLRIMAHYRCATEFCKGLDTAESEPEPTGDFDERICKRCRSKQFKALSRQIARHRANLQVARMDMSITQSPRVCTLCHRAHHIRISGYCLPRAQDMFLS